MVKLMAKIGRLFGGDPKKPRKAVVKKPAKPVKTSAPAKKLAKGHKPAKDVKKIAQKPAKKSSQKPKPAKKGALPPSKAKPVLKAIVKVQPNLEPERSLILFITPACPDCAAARKLVADVRRVVRNVVFREVDLSTRDGELEGLLNGIVDAPAFVINGRPLFRGVLPSREQLARIINEGPAQ